MVLSIVDMDFVGRTLGKYQILEQVGEGGMGIVYRALHPGLGVDVAIKVLAREFSNDPESLARFRRESQTLARLEHSGIVSIHDCDTQNGVPYYVMAFIGHPTLLDDIRQREAKGPYPRQRALTVTKSLLETLVKTHSESIIHRDIKPENVFVDPDGKTLLTDFGLARAINDHALTQTGSVLGTVAWMAPEQLDGAVLDERVDLYPVGLILYRLLCGYLPFNLDEFVQIIGAKCHQPNLKPPRSEANPIPPALVDHVLRLTAASPGERFKTARDALVALEALEETGNNPRDRVRARTTAPQRGRKQGSPGLGRPPGLGGSTRPGQGVASRLRIWAPRILIVTSLLLGLGLFLHDRNLKRERESSANQSVEELQSHTGDPRPPDDVTLASTPVTESSPSVDSDNPGPTGTDSGMSSLTPPRGGELSTAPEIKPPAPDRVDTSLSEPEPVQEQQVLTTGVSTSTSPRAVPTEGMTRLDQLWPGRLQSSAEGTLARLINLENGVSLPELTTLMQRVDSEWIAQVAELKDTATAQLTSLERIRDGLGQAEDLSATREVFAGLDQAVILVQWCLTPVRKSGMGYLKILDQQAGLRFLTYMGFLFPESRSEIQKLYTSLREITVNTQEQLVAPKRGRAKKLASFLALRNMHPKLVETVLSLDKTIGNLLEDLHRE